MARSEQYITRAKCQSCDTYIWTDPGGGGVVCPCGATEIQTDTIIRGGKGKATDAEMKRQIRKETKELARNIDVKQVTR